jgi:hypothetical protein
MNFTYCLQATEERRRNARGSSQRTWTKTGQRSVLNVGLDIMGQTFKELWPDLNRKVFKGK